MRSVVVGAAVTALAGALYARLTGFRALPPDQRSAEAVLWSIVVGLTVWSVVRLAIMAATKSRSACLLGAAGGVASVIVCTWALNGFTFELFSKAVRIFAPGLMVLLAAAAAIVAAPSRRDDLGSGRLALPLSLGLAGVCAAVGVGLYASGVLHSSMAYSARQLLLVVLSVTLPLLLVEASAQLAPAGRQRMVGRALAVISVIVVVVMLPPRG